MAKEAVAVAVAADADTDAADTAAMCVDANEADKAPIDAGLDDAEDAEDASVDDAVDAAANAAVVEHEGDVVELEAASAAKHDIIACKELVDERTQAISAVAETMGAMVTLANERTRLAEARLARLEENFP